MSESNKPTTVFFVKEYSRTIIGITCLLSLICGILFYQDGVAADKIMNWWHASKTWSDEDVMDDPIGYIQAAERNLEDNQHRDNSIVFGLNTNIEMIGAEIAAFEIDENGYEQILTTAIEKFDAAQESDYPLEVGEHNFQNRAALQEFIMLISAEWDNTSSLVSSYRSQRSAIKRQKSITEGRQHKNRLAKSQLAVAKYAAALSLGNSAEEREEQKRLMARVQTLTGLTRDRFDVDPSMFADKGKRLENVRRKLGLSHGGETASNKPLTGATLGTTTAERVVQ